MLQINQCLQFLLLFNGTKLLFSLELHSLDKYSIILIIINDINHIHFQDVPSFNLQLTLLLLSYDRLRSLKHPTKRKIPIRWALSFTWILSIAYVLPYYIHIQFIDLSVRNIFLTCDQCLSCFTIVMRCCYFLTYFYLTRNLGISSHHHWAMDKCASST